MCAIGKITVDDEEYSINADFQELTLQLADELDLDEVDSAKLLLDSQEDLRTLGRPLLECGVIRFHQQRKYLLDCMRICIEIASGDDEALDSLQGVFGTFVTENIYNGGTDIVSRCMASMQDVKNWLQKLADRVTTANVVYAGAPPRLPNHDLVEFARVSLVQQHELLALIMASAIDKRHAKAADFQNLLKILQKVDRYDQLLGTGLSLRKHSSLPANTFLQPISFLSLAPTSPCLGPRKATVTCTKPGSSIP
jgi:nuclear pore complex protein Nup205